VPTSSYRAQRRNGKGIKSQDDITTAIIRTNTIDSLMVFTNSGQMYRLLVDNIPEGTNASKGVPIKSLIAMSPDEVPSVIYSIYRDTDAKYVLFITKQGLVKKTSLQEFNTTKKKTGITAINLKEGDELAAVSLLADEDIIIITAAGQCIRFSSSQITATSRNTSGVKGVGLAKGDFVIAGLPIRDKNDDLAVFLTNGMGKRIALTEFLTQGRGGKGVMCAKITPSTGPVAAASLVTDDDNLLVIGDVSSICISASDINKCSRTSNGVAVIKSNKISSVSKV
jgi:DNA gyrase subunit A